MAKEQTPIWDDKRKRWSFRIQRDGVRKAFYSSNPSPRKGPAECRQKALEWTKGLESSALRFLEAWDRFLGYYEQKNRVTSFKQICARGKAHLVPHFERKILGRITKAEWQAVIDDAFANGARSVKTLKGIATTIRTFCQWCAAKGYIRDADVPIYFDMPTNEKSREKKILQPEQLATLLSEEEDGASWYIHAWRFLALTGIRRGELCALQRIRDYTGETITVRESISHDGDLTDGKTANAERTLFLGGLAKKCLADHFEAQKAVGLEGPLYLFTDPKGHGISPRVLRNHWQRWREAHGIDITLHELRHTYISYSRLKTGISLEELKKLYGHSRAMNTDGVYVHAIEETPEEARERLKRGKDSVVQIDRALIDLLNALEN